MEKVRQVIITDTHFGRYNNSINFLKSQLKEFEDLKQFITNDERDRFNLVHLGDVFESRSTISIYVLNEVKALLVELNKILKSRNPENKFIFVAGNHDFFSPSSDRVNSLDTIIKDTLPDAIIVSRECAVIDGDVFVPWYMMNYEENFMKTKDLFHSGDRIFTHCDCKSFYINKLPPDTYIYSGHIHRYRAFDNTSGKDFKPAGGKLYNLSPPYSLDYNDSNTDIKGFWVLDEYYPVLYKNTKSIRYRTFVNEEVFNIPGLDESIARGDNFRIYISEENRIKFEYIEILNKLSSDISYLTIIPTSESMIDTSESNIGDLDITNMLRGMLPDYLQEYFNIIKKEVEDEN